MNNAPLLITKVLLLVLAAFLAFKLADGIRGPIQYERESNNRFLEIEDKLSKIRDCQDAYFKVRGSYASTFDSLLMFIEVDSFRQAREELILRSEYDEAIHGSNPILGDDTAKYLLRDSFKVSVIDSLFGNSTYVVEELPLIPYGDGAEFFVSATTVSAAGGRYQVPVYVVTAPNRYLLSGLQKGYFEPDWGYQLGSLSEANTEILRTRYPVEYPGQ